MLSICHGCGNEFTTFNYKTKHCNECYDKILEEAIKELKESWLEHSNPTQET